MPNIRPQTTQDKPILKRLIWLLVSLPTVFLAYLGIWQFVIPQYQKFQYHRSIAFADTENNFDVLILPFSRHRGHKEWIIEENIVRRFREMDIEHLDVRFDSTATTTSDFNSGREIGTERKADMVIWGDLEAIPQDSSITSVSYSLVNPIDASIKSTGKTDDLKFFSLSEIREGHLLAEVDYVVRFVAGSFMYRRKGYAEALDQFSSLTSQYPDTSATLHFNMGNCSIFLGNLDNARKELNHSLEINPNYAEAHFSFAYLLNILDEVIDARKHYRQAIEINPQYFEAHTNLAVILTKSGDTKEARNHFRRAIKINPGNALIHNSFALMFLSLGDIVEARKHFNSAIKINPEYADAQYNLGKLLSELGNVEEAKKHLKRSIKINPELAEPHLELANLFVRLGKMEEAETHFKRAIQINPDSAVAHYNLANLLCYLERYTEGRSHAILAYTLDPNLPKFGPTTGDITTTTKKSR